MNNQFDGALILELTNTKDSTSIHTDTVRPLGVFGLHELMVGKGIPSTVINYVDYWDVDSLVESISTWCTKHAVRRPVVLCSTLFNTTILSNSTNAYKLIKKLKKQYNLTLLLGGPNNVYEFDDLKPDMMFLGRTLHLFEHWVDGLPISSNCLHIEDGVKVYRPSSSMEVVEMPIVSKLFDDYCLMPTDVLNFESRLGCRFNCSFCAFEFRNAKKIHDSNPDALYEFFRDANERYGVTHFSCADDTFNEDDTKIDTLLEAVERLDYKPYIVGFTRFDVLCSKPEQIDKLDKCGFYCHFWGTETFHSAASRKIRKGLNKQKAMDTMKLIREEYPHWWTGASYITGLPGEPIEHCIDTIEEIRKLGLVDSLSVIPLMIGGARGEDIHASEFSKNPEKFGLTLIREGSSFAWEHELCNEKTARIIAEKISSRNMRKGLTNRGPWNHISDKALGNVSHEVHIATYIAKKKVQMLD